MDTSLFEQISSSLAVKAICGPLGPDIPAGTHLLSVEGLLDPGDDPNLDPLNNPSRVIDSNGQMVGILWFENWGLEEEEADPDASIVDDVMERPEPFLSSDTTIVDAVELFGSTDSEVFYVIHINRVIGVLRYNDLFHPLGRLAFLALALEIEDLALGLCQFAPVREDCWQSISDNRKSKAIDVFKRRYGGEPNPKRDVARLIECTNLVDKANMIWKRQLIAPASRADVLGFFHRLKEIRDQCAHPGVYGALLAKEKLAHFVSSANRMRGSLRESMQNKGISLVRRKAVTLVELGEHTPSGDF
ncbi:MAG: CBS domain-containing protein [Dongiaceae bacterium]